MAEEARLDQLGAARRRTKQAEHRREVERLLEERRSEREEAQRHVEEVQREQLREDRHRWVGRRGRRTG